MAVLMNDHACREAIKELVCLVRDDALPARARDCMLASWLVALPKADNACRPIAGGTVVIKLAVCCSMITCDKTVTETFAEHGLQFGIGSPDGCLTASRLTQLVLEADPKHIVLKLDIQHAFQNTSRAKFLERLFQRAALIPLFRLLYFLYSRATLLIVRSRSGTVVAVIHSREGFKQGCQAGSFGFALTTLTTLITLSKEFQRVNISAILDDITLTGEEQGVFKAFTRLQELLEQDQLGIGLNKRKCCVLLGANGLTPMVCAMKWRFRLKHVKGTLELLGTIVGRDPERIESFLDNKFRSWAPTLDLLLTKSMPAQIAILLIRIIACQRPIYSAHSHRTSRTQPPAFWMAKSGKLSRKSSISHSTTPSPASCSKLH